MYYIYIYNIHKKVKNQFNYCPACMCTDVLKNIKIYET